MTDCTIRLPAQDELARLWHAVEPLLKRATDRSQCYEPIDLLRLAMAGQMGIWLVEREGEIVAALACKIEQYPRRRILEMLFCGGTRMRDWLPAAVPFFDDVARNAGCDAIACMGRAGWARAWGGTPADSVIVREL